ncbi:flagellar motor switch protein FliM [Luteimonas sp. C4P040a]|nr:flagellar motor switch protein FliM [Luteimonas fraxinea]MCD9126203.1 flagellar motor switch protein FliM [Luteimonas fraxinea]
MMSNELLSQDEIDALLHGVDSGAVGTDAPAAPGEVRPYDFARQGRVVRGRLPGLDAVNERFALAFKAGLFNLLRRSCELTIRGVDVVRFDEYMHSLPQPANLNVIQARPLRGNALVVFEPRLVFTVVDNFFGGGGRFPAKVAEREFTPTEQRIVQLMLRQVFADMTTAWLPVQALEFTHTGTESNPLQVELIDPRDHIVISRFSIALDGGGGDLHIALPYKMLEPLRDHLEATGPRRQRSDSDETWARHLRAGVEAAALELSVSLAHRQISLRELSRLKVGDVIPIELARPVQMEVESTPMFEGEFGTHNGFNALKVTQLKFPQVIPSNDSHEFQAATP